MKKLASLIVSTILVASSAQAATMTSSYLASSAVGSGSDHSLWISTGLGSGIGSDFDFDPDGLFSLFDDGTATLSGTVTSQDDNNSGFLLSFNYDDTFTFAPAFKSENGSAAAPDTIYRDLEGGTLIGFGDLAGLNLEVSRNPVNGPFATQIGPSNGVNIGANNKNQNLGLANWLFLSVIDDDCRICDTDIIASLNGKQADINIDLAAAPVPLPAAAVLLLSGLGGLFGFRRKKIS